MIGKFLINWSISYKYNFSHCVSYWKAPFDWWRIILDWIIINWHGANRISYLFGKEVRDRVDDEGKS